MKAPHELMAEEFEQTFPFFEELTPKQRWRLYRISEKINLQETGEECGYLEFLEYAPEFRWNVDEAAPLMYNDHWSYILRALRYNETVRDEVLADYSDQVAEFYRKRWAQRRARQRKNEARDEERKEEKFWRQFK